MGGDHSVLPVDPWTLVEPSLAESSAAQSFTQLLALAVNNWQCTDHIEVGDPRTEALLAKHRVTPSIPIQHAPDDQRARFRARVGVIYGTQLRLEAVAREVLQILNDESIESRVLKGMASAELDYPTRDLRQSGDVDLALRFDQFEPAIAALQRHGYTDRTVYSPFLLKGTTLDAPNGIEVDVHTRLFRRSRRQDVLFDDPGESLTYLPGVALCAEHRLVHAAGHFILTPPGLRRMSGLLDVTVMRARADLDLDKARDFASQLRVEAIVGDALRLESELAGRGQHDIDRLAGWRTSGWLDRSTRLSAERNLVLDHLNRFREVPRSEWLGYLPHWLVPDKRLRQKFLRSVKARRAR